MDPNGYRDIDSNASDDQQEQNQHSTTSENISDPDDAQLHSSSSTLQVLDPENNFPYMDYQSQQFQHLSNLMDEFQHQNGTFLPQNLQYMNNQPQQFQHIHQQSNLIIQPSVRAGIQPQNGTFLPQNLITGSSNRPNLKRNCPDGSEQNFSKFQRTESQQVFNNGNVLSSYRNQLPKFTESYNFAPNFTATNTQFDGTERYARWVVQQLKDLTKMANSFEGRVLDHNTAFFKMFIERVEIMEKMFMERIEIMEKAAIRRHEEVLSRLDKHEEMIQASMKGGLGVKWPREEVDSLIDARIQMDGKFKKAGLKGKEKEKVKATAALWEEVSSEMETLGYMKDAQKCKEKWDNVNKYYKKKMEEEGEGKVSTSKTCFYIELLRDFYSGKMVVAPSLDICEGEGDDNQLLE